MTWFRCTESRPWASLRLFCFPHAGGSAVAYRSWAKEATAAVEVQAVQYPGRADRMADAFVGDAHQLARLIAGSMTPLLDRPAAFFGHSMGAIIAYETARLLAERGYGLLHLFVSGTRPPHDRGEPEHIAELDDDGVVAELAKLGGSDAEVLQDPEMRELILPYVRNDFRLIESYVQRPGPKLGIPVTALIGSSDSHVTEDQAAGWAETTDSAFTLKTFPGDHFYLVPEQTKVIHTVLDALHVPH